MARSRLLLVSSLLVSCGPPGTDPTAPIAFELPPNDTIELDEDTRATVVLTADVNTRDFVSFELVQTPEIGTLVGTGSTYEYAPFRDFNGTDTIRWRAFVGAAQSEIVTTTLVVVPVNDAPVGADTAIATPLGRPVSGVLPAEDIDGDALTFELTRAARYGSVSRFEGGSFTYTPRSDFLGDDVFEWTAADPEGLRTGPHRVDITVSESHDIVEDFASGIADRESWIGQPTGDAAIDGTRSANDSYSLRLGEGGGELESLPIDWSNCSAVAWDLRWGTDDGPFIPLTNDSVRLEAWDEAGSRWFTLWEQAGSGFFEPFAIEAASTTDSRLLHEAARVRFMSPDTGNVFGDGFFIDDIVIGCDADQDGLPDHREMTTYGTDLADADTDGDGVDDGAEILAGTDPLAP